MSQIPADSTAVVLHVYPERALREARRKHCDSLNALAANGQCAVETFGDVYRALARIGRDDDHALRAVLVCTDELTPAELEFFELLRRRRHDIALGVYGAARARVARCVALGAREIDSDAAIRALIGRVDRAGAQDSPEGDCNTPTTRNGREGEAVSAPAARPGPGTSATSVPEGVTEAPLVSAVGPSRAAQPPIVVTEHDDEEVDESTETSAPPRRAIRVPWLKYEDGPSRAAPPSVERPTDPRRPANAPTHPLRAPYEPLLTDEELRALIGDDLVSLGPERGRHNDNQSGDDEETG